MLPCFVYRTASAVDLKGYQLDVILGHCASKLDWSSREAWASMEENSIAMDEEGEGCLGLPRRLMHMDCMFMWLCALEPCISARV
jgi:hypothetical protein